MFKKVLSLLLCIVLCVSLLPLSAFAEEETGADDALTALVEEPEPTPEVTPEPTEEPAPTPEATPEPTEEPAPTPEVTPEPTPEVTPEPTETPAPTPVPTAEPEEPELYTLSAAQWNRIFSRDDGVWLFPLDKAHYGNIIDWNGCRQADPCLFCGEVHSSCTVEEHSLCPYGAWGLDISVPAGTEIYAPANGTLWWTDWEWDGIGYTAILEHPAENDWAYYTVFQHLNSIDLSSGSPVAAGDCLALSGSSGDDYEPEHLIYALFMAPSGLGARFAADPITELAAIEAYGWLEEPQGWGMINNSPSAESEAQPEPEDAAILPVLAKHPGTVRYSFDPEKVTVNLPQTVQEPTPETTPEPTPEPTPASDSPKDFSLTATDANIVASGTCGSNLTWTLDDTGLLTISGTGAMKDYASGLWSDYINYSPWISYTSDIKTLVIEPGVTEISVGAFYDCGALTSVTIPASITCVRNRAFAECNNPVDLYISDLSAWCGISRGGDYTNPTIANLYLNNELITDLVIPDGFTSVRHEAFYNMKGLNSVKIPAGVTAIGDEAFAGCSGLTEINIPAGVTVIEIATFSGCSGLTKVNIPAGVTSIRANAFSSCSGLTKVNIPAGVTSIERYAFGYCSSLTEVTIPDGVTSIAERAFNECSALKSVVIPGSVTTIGDCAFYRCGSLTEITISDGVTSIGNGAFSGCSSLTEITIPEGVTSIGNTVFSDCRSLTTVKLPGSLTSVGEKAFYSCEALTGVYISDVAAWCGISWNNAWNDNTSNPLCYAHNLYLNNELVTELVIPEGVTAIKSYAFYYCSSITSVKIPDSVTSIGAYAFEACKALTGVYISDLSAWCGISWGSNPLYYAHNLYLNNVPVTELVIPDGVTEIKAYAFRGGSITSVKIPDSVTSIGTYAFSGCTSLQSIEIPSSVSTIGEYAFESCESLQSIAIPTAVSVVEQATFKGCTSLQSVIIPYGVTDIKGAAFEGCGSLQSINIPDTVTSIGGSAFKDCYDLRTVYLPDGITEIAGGTFRSCHNLISVYIPENVTKIGMYAFKNCRVLTSVVIPKSVTYIDEDAFGASALKDVFYTGSRESWNKISIQRNNEKLKNATIHTDSDVGDIGGIEIEGKMLVVYANEKSPEGQTEKFVLCDGVEVSTGESRFVTNENGEVTISNAGAVVEFYKTGYVTRTLTVERLRKNNMVRLQKQSDYPVISALWWENVDILHEDAEIDPLKTGDINLCPEVDWGTGSMRSLMLYQEGYAIDLANGTDSAVVVGNFDLSKDIFLVATNDKGLVSKKLLRIHSSDVTSDSGFSFNFGDGIGFTLPDFFGPFAGTELGFGVYSPVPVEVTNINGKIYMTIGFQWDDEKDRDDKDGKKEWVKKNAEGIKGLQKKILAAKSEAEARKQVADAMAAFGGDVAVVKGNFGYETGVKIMAFAEGYMDVNHQFVMTAAGGLVYVHWQGNISRQYLVMAGPVPVPCFWEVSFGSDLQAKLNMYINKEIQQFTPEIELRGKLFGLSGGAGVGSAIVAHVAGGLDASFPGVLNWDRGDVKYAQIKAVLGWYIRVKAGMFTKNESGTFAEGVLYEYPDPGSGVSTYSLRGENGGGKPDFYDASQYTMDDLSYLTGGSRFMGRDLSGQGRSTYDARTLNNNAPFVSNAYVDASPQAVNFSDGCRLAVWIGYNDAYAGADALNLYYSYYDGGWTTPQVVEADGTSDAFPCLKVVGDTAYLVWQNANGSISDDATLDGVAGMMGVSAAVFDREAMTFTCSTITSGGVMDTIPTLCGSGSTVYAVWLRNGENDWFGQNYSNSILCSSFSEGSWTAPTTLYSGLGPVVSMDACYSGGLSVAYSMDGDCDLNTCGDIEVYRDGVALTSNDWLDNGVCFSGGNLYWYSGGRLMENGNDTMAEDAYMASDRFQVINENGVKAVVYASDDGLASVLCAAYYDYASGGWGSPITLYRGGTSIPDFSATALPNGEISVLMLSQTVVGDYGSENPYGEASLVWYNAPMGSNLRVDDVRFDNTAYVLNKDMPIYVTVSNTGELAIHTVKIELLDEDGTLLQSTDMSQQILSGQTVELTALYRVKEIVQGRKLTVKVTPNDVTETDTEDNSAELVLGWNDLEVGDVSWGTNVNGETVIHAAIINRGYEAQNNVAVELRETGPDGTLVDTATVAELAPFSMESVSFTISDTPADVYYVCVEHRDVDENYGNDNNYTHIQVELPTTGSCGENLTWVMDPETGVLTISGTGAMTDYSAEVEAPWAGYGAGLKTLVIEEGVTSVGSFAFAGNSGLRTVTIPASVSSIGEQAFANCKALSRVEFEHSSTDSLTIAEDAFASYSAHALTVCVADPENINPAISGYDWAGNNQTVSYENLPCRHVLEIDPAVEPTCTETGRTEGSHCSVCGEVIVAQATISAIGHTSVTDPAVAATCTENGKTEGSHCSACGEVLVAQEVIPATGHSFGEWTETKAPSLTEDGEETRTCQNPGCDVSETRAVKAVIYTISYDANGGSGAPEAQQKLKGTALTLSSMEPTYSGFVFKGWALSKTATTAAYAPGASYTEDANATLYAVWEQNGADHIPGDVNGDGKVNTKDFITLMKYLAGEDVVCVPNSTDINGDGKVNTKDFITLMRYVAGEEIEIH